MREAGWEHPEDGGIQAWTPRRARKEHPCDGGCDHPIRPGDQYLEIRWQDGGWHRALLCEGCLEEHQRQAIESGWASWEVADGAKEDGLAFDPETRRWIPRGEINAE